MRPFTQVPSLKNSRVNRDLAFLIVTVFLTCVPFLGQPIHMDDNFYMDMARNAIDVPLFPNDMPYVFEGRYLPDMGSHSHPPLQTYILALFQMAIGEGVEHVWIYHACALIFPLLAVVAFYYAASLFVERPLWPSLALAVTPVFMVLSHTLMTDIPNLAYWSAAIAFFLYAEKRNKGNLYVTSGIFQFVALFTSYQSILLPMLLGYYHFRVNKKSVTGWLAVTAPVFLMAGWLGMSSMHYGRFLLGDTFGYIQSRQAATLESLGIKILAVVEYQGWMIIFPLFVLLIFSRSYSGRLMALCSVFAIYLSQLVVPNYRFLDKTIFVIGIVAGIYIFFMMLNFLFEARKGVDSSCGFERAEGEFLGLWYLTVVFCCIVLFTEGSARYLLPLVPPLLIVFFRKLETAEIVEYRIIPRPRLGASFLANGCVILTAAFGLLLSHADKEMAEVYPRAVAKADDAIGNLESYYAGEWGFRYYFERAGFNQIPIDEALVRGTSFIIRPRLALPYRLPSALDSMLIPIETFDCNVSTRLRLIDLSSPAGFYSTAWGLIPFSISSNPLESVEICQVDFMIERLPSAHVTSDNGAEPWPGLWSVNGNQIPAIFLSPGTSLRYPWDATTSKQIDVLCALSLSGTNVDESSEFTFEIIQREEGGEVLARAKRTIQPKAGYGLDDSTEELLSLRLQPVPPDQNHTNLEFRFDNTESEGVIGVFAMPVFIDPSRLR